MDKKGKRRSLRTPGLSMARHANDAIKESLQAAAAAEEEEMDGHNKSSNNQIEQRHSLCRQDAVQENETSRSHPKLPHQSKSDPSHSCYNITISAPVQETGGNYLKVGVSVRGEKKRREYRSSGYGTGSKEESQQKSIGSNISDYTDEELFNDCPDSFSNNIFRPETSHNIQRSFSDGHYGNNNYPTSRRNLQQHQSPIHLSDDTNSDQIDGASGTNFGKSLRSVAESSSFYLPNNYGASATVLSQFQTEKSSFPKESTDEDNENESMRRLRSELIKEVLQNGFQRCDSSKSANLTFIQGLAALREKSAQKRGQHSFNRFSALADKKESMGFSQDSYSFDSYDPGIQRQLEKSARCHDSACQKCVEMRSYLKVLQDPNNSVKSASKEELILKNMFHHSFNCTSSRCPFYWCDIPPKHIDQSSHQQIIDEMKRRVEHYALDPFIGDAKIDNFIKLDLNYQDYPEEDVDWTVLVRLGHSRNTVLVSPTKQDKEESMEMWVIKKVVVPIEGDSQANLYRCIHEMQHPGIVRHLWAASFVNPEMFVISTSYEGESLKEKVDTQPIQSVHLVVNLMLKLTEIVQDLHRNGILFLNWSGSNIVIDQTLTRVKLADFTASAKKEQVEYDITDLAAYLPLHLHPPELLGSPKILDEKSDIWGLGCLLHEIVTGKPVWYRFQHETLEGLRKKMMECKRPSIPTSCKELVVIFKACWELDRSSRPVLDELNQLLIDASLGNRRKSSTINVFQVSN